MSFCLFFVMCILFAYPPQVLDFAPAGQERAAEIQDGYDNRRKKFKKSY